LQKTQHAPGPIGDLYAIEATINGRSPAQRSQCDPPKPSRARRIAPKLPNPLHRPQKNFLSNVLGLFTVAHHSQAQAKNPVPMGREDLRPGPLVPSQQSFEQLVDPLPATHLDRTPGRSFRPIPRPNVPAGPGKT
jgi:hypothetical protein